MPTSQPRLDWSETQWAQYHEEMMAEARARVLERERADMIRAATPKRRQPLRARAVFLSRSGVQAIHAELLRHATAYVEGGGPVYGKISDTSVSINRAEAWPDETTTRQRDQITFHGGDQISDPAFVGTWHSHLRHDATPSAGDLFGTAELLDDLERSSLALVIASYGHGGEAGLARGLFDLDAYLVTRDQSGQATYETMTMRVSR